MVKGLILAPGLDNFIAEFAIGKISPDYVAFLVTRETMPLVNKIIENFDIKKHKTFFVKDIFSTSETVHEFLNAFQWMKSQEDLQEVFIDATNCITVMEMATYVSASLIDLFRDILEEKVNFRLVYVHADYEIKADGVAGEIRGTEKLVELEKPIDSLSFVLAFDAIKSFNRRRYEQASEDFAKLVNYSTGEKVFLYEGLTSLAKGYDLWDKMDFGNARGHLEKACGSLARIREFTSAKNIWKKLESNLLVLRELDCEAEILTILDLYTNALRREKEGRFDDALARLYSCLERITQYQLKKYNINTKNPNYSGISKEVLERFERGLGFLPDELELKKNIYLLMLLGDEIVDPIKEISYKTVLGLIGIRNNSILAHGTKPVSLKNFTDFKEKLMDPVISKFREIYAIEDTQLDRHQHIFLENINDILERR